MNERNPFAIEKKTTDQIIADHENDQRLKKALRLKFARDKNLIEIIQDQILSDDEKASKLTDHVIDDFVEGRPETTRKISLQLIQEFKKLSSNSIQQVIVDFKGNAIAELSPETVYYPTLIDEDGNETLGMPIIHPAISAKLMLDDSNEFEVIKLEQKNPVYAFNMEIEKNQDRLVDIIKNDAQNAGMKIGENDGPLYTDVIGKESTLTIYGGNRNVAFSREPVWSKLFLKALEGKSILEIVNVERCQDELFRWIEITYRSK